MNADPLVIDFEVNVPPAQAFDTWTRRCATWWPASHTVSGDPAAISFEPRAGGRIVERTRAGGEHDRGTVLDWQPPTRVRYAWHLHFEPDQATEVEITFTALGDRTAVHLEQRGFERLGTGGVARRTRTAQIWGLLAAAYAHACDAGGAR